MNATQSTDTSPSLCVLVVEDEMLVAMMLEGMLRDLGYRVIKAARVAKAIGLATSEAIDAAILDVNLAGETSYQVADVLRLRGIPFVFASGYDPGSLRADFRNVAVLRKPYMPHDVRQVVADALRPCG
ncbi:MAG: response regulator [Acetobacteraceae bacterium]|jgi:CheY-like chemotaxis protein